MIASQLPDDSYERHKKRMADASAQRSASGRDIGSIPAIANPDRRAECRHSLRLFCEVYNPEAFFMGWSSDHLRAIERIEEAVLQRALFAFAMPRGSGKTTICRMAALWAVSYAHSRYVYVIGANAAKAADTLDAVKTFMRFLPNYAEDFPEISYPAQRLNGIAQGARGQLCDGASTLLEWSQERVVLPHVPPPKNWPKDWKLSKAGMVPTATSIIGVSGLTGDGIRGSVHALPTGEQVRPDLVLLDDPQTDESAASGTQNASRERLIAGAVLGMAGPGRSISAVMPCTVIRQGDMVDRVLNREIHPLWRGERCRMLKTMPTNLEAWEMYFEAYRHCAQMEPPDFSEANAHYRANRETLDAGAEASWQDRKDEWEVSAIQHAMHLYCRDRTAFFAEYQNEPLPDIETDIRELTAGEIAGKVNHLARGTVPAACEKLSCFVDVQGNSLWSMVAAWGPEFTGAVIDYGVYPEQPTTYFAVHNLLRSMVPDGAAYTGALLDALQKYVGYLLGKSWVREDGLEMRIERLLIDANYGDSTSTVTQFCRQPNVSSIVIPSHGKGITASNEPMDNVKAKQGETVGPGWRLGRYENRAGRRVIYDTNFWKSFVHARLAVTAGDSGSLTMFAADERAGGHRLLSDHLTAEYRVKTFGRGRELNEWKVRPNRTENHWFDCLVGCAVAASMQGVTTIGAQVKQSTPRKRLSLSEMQNRAAGR